jgi:DNA-binding CsgD family transcriptional regulator
MGWAAWRTAIAHCALGALPEALEAAERALELAVAAGLRANEATALAAIAHVAAQLGDERRVRDAAARALEAAEGRGAGHAARMAHAAIGALELSRGDPVAAHAQLGQLVAHARGRAFAEPGAMAFVPDDVEALAATGAAAAAQDVLDWYEGCARATGRLSALAAAGRCRGLLVAAAGDPADGARLVRTALDLHPAGVLPLERARTLLALGVTGRRARRKRPARDALDEALGVFERLGARLWAERTREELARIGGRRPAGDRLTPTERRVASLVAQGRTNQQVAAELFVSVRSVEANLTRVYAKLALGSRTELAAQRERLGL